TRAGLRAIRSTLVRWPWLGKIQGDSTQLLLLDATYLGGVDAPLPLLSGGSVDNRTTQHVATRETLVGTIVSGGVDLHGKLCVPRSCGPFDRAIANRHTNGGRFSIALRELLRRLAARAPRI